MSTLDDALRYAADGHPVFPVHGIQSDGRCTCGWDSCPAPGKHPAVANGLRGATKDTDLIRSWWAEFDDWNIGLRCDGHLILDCDGDPGQDFHAGLAMLLEHGELPHTRSQATGGGGVHLIFRLPHGVEIGNSNARLLEAGVDGVDVRGGDRGYIVAAPSRHASGRLYEMDKAAIAEAPEWLCGLLRAEPRTTPTASGSTATSASSGGSRYGLAALDGLVEQVGRAERGSRNTTLNTAAFKAGQLVAGRDLDEGQVRLGLADAARRIGLGEREIRQTIDSGLRAGACSPRSSTNPTPAADLEPGPRRWLTVAEVLAEPPATMLWIVEGLIQPATLGTLAGLPKTYKSFLALELAFAVATGEPLLGEYKILDSGPVLYVWQDDSHENMHARIHRLAQARHVDEPQLSFLLNGGCRLPEDSDMLGEQVVASGAKLLVLDSLYQFVVGTDMKGEEVLPALDALKRIADKTGAAFLIVDHARKPTDGTFTRGSYGSVFKPATFRWGIHTEPFENSVALTSFANNGPVILNRQHITLDRETLLLQLVDAPSTRLDDADYDDRVYAFVDEHPAGVSRTDVREGKIGKQQKVSQALDRLIEQGRVVEHQASTLGREGSARICFTDRSDPSVPRDTDE